MLLLDASHAQNFLKHLDIFEGRIPHLYLDNARQPNVTCGIGCVIASAQESQKLAWAGAPNIAGPARISLISQEWFSVKEAPPGILAAEYAHLTQLRLPDAEINLLRDAKLAEIELGILRVLPYVRSLPMCAITAIEDMSWNLGPQRLHEEYLLTTCHFGPALARRDWKTAARESARLGIQPERNQYVYDLIMEAAG